MDPFIVIDVISVFIGALVGALVARRLRYDFMGHWALALVSGLGGGITRDVLIQEGPPLALTEPPYLPAVLIAALVSALFGTHLDRFPRTILVIDAISISNFAVVGSVRAINVGLDTWATILLGVITAVGGGIIRQVLVGETPTVFKRSELYALAALATSVFVVILDYADVSRTIIIIAGMAFGTFLRLGSVKWGWMSWQPR